MFDKKFTARALPFLPILMGTASGLSLILALQRHSAILGVASALELVGASLIAVAIGIRLQSVPGGLD
ncbi:TPA: hypothetical protein VDB83_005126 [Burkholderia cenocepacia]|nr:hypothetical protein [Burkholderia cenocepacia]